MRSPSKYGTVPKQLSGKLYKKYLQIAWNVFFQYSKFDKNVITRYGVMN